MNQVTRSGWLGIKLRHLAALSAVAREGSFRGAADQLGYVQSAVSQQVAHLERLVGTRLLVRRRGIAPVALTPAGELLLQHFDEILAHFGAAQADIVALREGRGGRLHVGVTEAVATRLMPAVLVGFGRREPGVQVETEETRSAAALAAAVERGDLDLAFGELPLPPGPFEARELGHDPYVLLVPSGWPLAEGAGPVTADDLRDLPLVGYDRERLASRVEPELRAHGISPSYVFHSDMDTAAQALVAAEVGAAIMPRLAVNPSDERTVARELDGILGRRTLALYWSRERLRPPAFNAFVEAAALACLEAFTEGRNYMMAA